MDFENKNNNSFGGNVRPSVRLSVSPSIFEVLEDVKRQVEFWCFERTGTNPKGQTWKHTDPIFEELCLIVAEVYVMNPNNMIRVGGADLPVSIVQEVYAKLNNEHFEMVVTKFQRITTQVFQKKAYLRTALYNTVFEVHSGTTNDLAQDMPWIFERRGGGSE